jgi:hypothetical protein
MVVSQMFLMFKFTKSVVDDSSLIDIDPFLILAAELYAPDAGFMELQRHCIDSYSCSH